MVRSQIPEEELIQEKAATRVRMQHKSEEAVERLVAKRVEAYSAAVCLLEQPLRKHDGKTVQEVLTELQTEAGQKVTIHRFVRYRLGDS
jgi:elongation factor Ts